MSAKIGTTRTAEQTIAKWLRSAEELESEARSLRAAAARYQADVDARKALPSDPEPKAGN